MKYIEIKMVRCGREEIFRFRFNVRESFSSSTRRLPFVRSQPRRTRPAGRHGYRRATPRSATALSPIPPSQCCAAARGPRSLVPSLCLLSPAPSPRHFFFIFPSFFSSFRFLLSLLPHFQESPFCSGRAQPTGKVILCAVRCGGGPAGG